MFNIVFLDAGHGDLTPGKRTPVFPDGSYKNKFMPEREFNHAVVTKIIEQLKKYDTEIIYVSETGTPEVSLKERTDKANARFNSLVKLHGPSNVNALFVSIHANAKDGIWNSSNGIETYYNNNSAAGKVAATEIQKQLISATKLRDRGVKTANFHITRETAMTAVLCECGFMDNLEEAKLLISNTYRASCANAISKGIVNYMKLKVAKEEITISDNKKVVLVNKSTKVISDTTASLSQCVSWAKSLKATDIFIENASIYFTLAQKVGVNPVFAYVQYALESGYGSHKGTVPASYCNPCGLKTTAGGSDSSSSAHTQFKNWEEGISAHIDHIALYAGAKGYPNSKTKDPRHFKELLGKGKTIETICKGWCPSNPNYTTFIVDAMNKIATFKNNDYEAAVALLVSNKYINSPNVWQMPNEKYIDQLICNVCKSIYKSASYKDAIDQLSINKVINSPSIWLNKTYTSSNVKDMVIKLAKLIS